MQQNEVLYLPFALLAVAFCVNADAATDLTAAGVRGLLSSLAAVEATRAEVCSFTVFLEDMLFPLSVRGKGKDGKLPLRQPRHTWIRQTVPSGPDSSASAGIRTPVVLNGSGYTRAQKRFSIGYRPWPTPHEN